MLGPGSWVSVTWWVMCVNPHRDGSSGLCITTAYISLQGRIQMPRYSQWFSVSKCFDQSWPKWQEEGNAFLRCFCRPDANWGNFKKYFIFGFLPSVRLPNNLLGGGPKILVQIFMELVPLLSGRTTNSQSLIFPWYLRHNLNQGTKI